MWRIFSHHGKQDKRDVARQAIVLGCAAVFGWGIAGFVTDLVLSDTPAMRESGFYSLGVLAGIVGFFGPAVAALYAAYALGWRTAEARARVGSRMTRGKSLAFMVLLLLAGALAGWLSLYGLVALDDYTTRRDDEAKMKLMDEERSKDEAKGAYGVYPSKSTANYEVSVMPVMDALEDVSTCSVARVVLAGGAYDASAMNSQDKAAVDFVYGVLSGTVTPDAKVRADTVGDFVVKVHGKDSAHADQVLLHLSSQSENYLNAIRDVKPSCGSIAVSEVAS